MLWIKRNLVLVATGVITLVLLVIELAVLVAMFTYPLWSSGAQYRSRALDRMTERLDFALSVTRHLESVATNAELRAAYNEALPKASAFYSSIPLHAGLWRALKDYAATAEARALTGPRRRFVDKTLESFRRHGADLDAARIPRCAAGRLRSRVACREP